jgi:hypothetical protein
MSALSNNDKIQLVNGYRLVYSATNPQNPTGKSYLDFTSQDIAKLDSGELLGIRRLIRAEQYDVIDQILPRNMSRSEFGRAILRESARRGEITRDYAEVFRDVPNYSTMKVNVTRQAFGAADSIPQRVTELAAVIAIRDAGIEMAVNNAPQFNLKPDIAAALGKKTTDGVLIDTDVKAYDFGYMTGAMPQFNKGDALHIRLQAAKSPEELQQAYCPVIANLFEEGRAYNNRDSFALGFMQARIDGRSNFQPSNDRVGLFADCPIRKSGASR